MTDNEALLLQNFEAKLTQLLEFTDRLKAEKIELMNTIETLQKEVELLKTKNLELEKRNEKLKLVKAIMGDREDDQTARMKVNRLVREIDKCIALLNR